MAGRKMRELFQDVDADDITCELIVGLLKDVLHSNKAIEETVSSSMDTLRTHIAADEKHFADLMKAFPSSDVDGHRQYHESMIEWRKTRTRLVNKCLDAAVAAGFVGMCGWLIYAIFIVVKMEFRQ